MHSENRARRLTVTGCLFKFKNKKRIALKWVGPHDPSVAITKILGLLLVHLYTYIFNPFFLTIKNLLPPQTIIKGGHSIKIKSPTTEKVHLSQ